jgi:hypothetical protein
MHYLFRFSVTGMKHRLGDLRRLPELRPILMLSLGLLMATLFLVTAPFGRASEAQNSYGLQIPTGSIPTVTGTPVGALAVILDNEQGFINVRAGPSTVAYDIIGVLITGQQVPALGRSTGGDWIQVAYPGAPGGVAWVYSDLVEVRGTLPIIEPPPTPTPRVTATIDPTLAAQFLVEVQPTRLPTFTAPPPLVMPTFAMSVVNTSANTGTGLAAIPKALIIIGLGLVGFIGLLVSFLRTR